MRERRYWREVGMRSPGRQDLSDYPTMVCSSCRQPCPDEARFCSSCGARLRVKALPGRRERFKLQCSLSELPRLAALYDVDDDSEMFAIGRAARARGHYLRSELIPMCRWKTPRTQRLVAGNTEEAVAAATRAALDAVDEHSRITSLIGLQGVAVPTASVLLHFAFPERYPIIDWRALEALGQPARSQYSVGYWLEYAAYCRELAAQEGLTMRGLDKALWQYSYELSQNRAAQVRRAAAPTTHLLGGGRLAAASF